MIEKRRVAALNMVVDFIHQGRNEVLLPLWMNGSSLTMKKLGDSLENLVLRKCLQIAVTITLMTLTLWKSSLHVLQLCLLRRHSYIALFLKKVIRECLSNDFRMSQSANHNSNRDANLQCYIYIFFLDIIILCYVCSIMCGRFGSYEH